MNHINLQFTTAQFQTILKARIAATETLIAKATDDETKRKQAAEQFGHTALAGLHHMDRASPVEMLKAEIERLTLIHDHLAPDATFTVTAAEALGVLYDPRGGNAYAMACC